jgi:hypothetical protein
MAKVRTGGVWIANHELIRELLDFITKGVAWWREWGWWRVLYGVRVFRNEKINMY